MRWRDLGRFRDARVPKLDRLRRAARAGLRVPATRWCLSKDVPDEGEVERPPFAGPWLVRSASSLEDGDERSHAGRFHSEWVPAGVGPGAYADAVRRVAASLGDDPRAALFVQPFARARRAGVAFFDGFHYERTWSPGDNHALTSGGARGEVELGSLERGAPWSAWLERVARAFPELDALDLEWAEDEAGFVLLQARRATFAVRRDPLVSVANHREILGAAPSPWIVSVLDDAGQRAFSWFGESDPAVARWGERYARVAGGRAWMDFGAFFRLMDHWGLPRTFVTEGVGGGVGGGTTGPRDARPRWGRLVRSAPRLVRLQIANVRAVLGMRRELARVERAVRDAADLRGLHEASVLGLLTALRTNFALGGALAGVQRVRRALGIRAAARVVTGEMGAAYEDLRRLPSHARPDALDAWLARFGHRGPLESDPVQPRFDELREELLADLARGVPATEAARATHAGRGPLFWFERRREAFRDELMRVWRDLRWRMLEEGERARAKGRLDRAEQVFYLTGSDLDADDLAARARAGEEEWRRTRDLVLPHTARLSEVEARAAGGAAPAETEASDDHWSGIGLGGRAVEGRVLRADELRDLLGPDAPALGREDVLVVPALEPSWGVFFGRVGAVVAELGGELSHASILLRELGTPAVVNCFGVLEGLRTGDRVVVDPRRGTVRILVPEEVGP